MKRAVYLTETERDLAIKVFEYAADTLGVEHKDHSASTKMARLWTREQVLSLKFKFETVEFSRGISSQIEKAITQ